MDIRQIHPADAAFSDWFAVYHAASVADDPTGPQTREHEARATFEPNEHRDVLMWLAEDEGRAVGAACLLLPLRDNVGLGEPELYVRPDARGRGVGTTLLEIVERTADERGRTRLLTFVSSAMETPETPGTRFAERHGFTHRLTEVRHVQRRPFPLDDIEDAVAAAKPRAAKYDFVTWRDHAPDEHVGEYARLEGRLSTDSPIGDVEYEGELWDESRIRTMEHRQEQAGRNIWATAAIAPDGQMAGFTQVVIARDSDRDAIQDTTIVDPAHRGNRLGIVLKATNFERILADRPAIQQVWTWNGDTNSHIMAINKIMGYRVEGWDKAFQRDIRL